VTELIDITVPLRTERVPIYPGDTPLRVERVSSLADGAAANVSRLECTAHIGTHVDAPVHFLDEGGGVETVPLDALIGPAYVVDARAATTHLDAAAVDALDIPPGAERILLLTPNCALWEHDGFTEDFLAVTEDGARVLVERGVRLVGIDYLSIAPYDDPGPTHRVLLGAGVAVVEGLDLRRAQPGRYHLTCLPLRLHGADGAPARAVLLPDPS
jgi:arylformamidase